MKVPDGQVGAAHLFMLDEEEEPLPILLAEAETEEDDDTLEDLRGEERP